MNGYRIPYFVLALIYGVIIVLSPLYLVFPKTLLGQFCGVALGAFSGQFILPEKWHLSFSNELLFLLNPGFITGFIVGKQEYDKRGLIQGMIPGLLCLAPALVLPFIPGGLPYVIYLAPIVIVTLPHAVLGTWLGRSLTIRFCGRRPGEE